MTTVLDEVTDENINSEHIQRRVEDWVERVKSFYDLIGEWLPEGWSSREGPSVIMHEKLMRKFNVAATMIPTLILINAMGTTVSLQPRGLWIIGANGRIDMKWDGHHFIILDVSENFESPNWQVSSIFRRLDQVELTKSWLQQTLP